MAADILSLIRVPVVRRWIDSNSFVRCQQFVITLHPHASPHDFSNSRHQAVHALCHPQVLGFLLHVERLDLHWEMRQEDRSVDDIRHFTLRRLGDVVAESMRLSFFVRDIVLAQPIDGVGVAHALEGAFWSAEVGVQGGDEGGGGGVREDDVDDGAHDEFEVGEQVVEGDEVELGFDVCVFG